MFDNALADRDFHHSAPFKSALPLKIELSWAVVRTIAAAILLFFLAPLMLLIALAVVCQDGGPAIFSHARLGRNGRTFRCLKFRTMAVDAEAKLGKLLEADPAAREEWLRDQKLRKDPRVTALGQLLRKSSLDELPQLFNILRGEMCFVGPRPIVQAEVERYGSRIRYYYAVRPGVTGLWQVSGRNDVSYRRRVAMDCLYVRHKSPAYDVWLIALTIPAVFLRRGCY